MTRSVETSLPDAAGTNSQVQRTVCCVQSVSDWLGQMSRLKMGIYNRWSGHEIVLYLPRISSWHAGDYLLVYW